ncbi:diacylglycerol kinase [Halopolyspora algeriensis]|uniref:Diacylglycerol kinase n=1 Tax=Halopolyspora algeriensis TaxID=1500506 RepID=A0A368VH21_9ACTN|nr:YegS/Rv2252/BmrU family lipid kinase [Halopolyspora algeriensis]RCW40479.1 diacylglycerol kinase [Halopolyspora algeriensis]TQM53762.1 diacylglycerol kinase [Halopolyspora algeriensis]
MRSVLLVNPVAGGGSAAKVAGAVVGHLQAVSDVGVVTTADPAATANAAVEAVAGGADVLAVLGGDGAAHAAVQACAGTSTALAVIPTGTGNDLARALGMPLDPVVAARAVAQAMQQGTQDRIDLGRIAGGGWFATVLCAGFDASVNARVNRMRWPRGKRRYDLAVLRELLSLHVMPLRIETDGEMIDMEAALVAVGNTTSYGGGIPICPDADPRDGAFDLTVVGEVSRGELLRVLPTLRTGHHVDHPAVQTLRAHSVRLGGDNGWLAHADGEPQARLPLTVRCEPEALRVVTPRLPRGV